MDKLKVTLRLNCCLCDQKLTRTKTFSTVSTNAVEAKKVLGPEMLVWRRKMQTPLCKTCASLVKDMNENPELRAQVVAGAYTSDA